MTHIALRSEDVILEYAQGDGCKLGCEVTALVFAHVQKPFCHVLWIDDTYVDYAYLPDGTKLSALNYDEEGYRYAGPFRFRSTYEETFLESIAAAGGRIVRQEHPNSPATYEPRYFITDHLGSTRVVVDSLGTIVQQADYLPYGEKCRNSTLTSGENDYLYGGKEFQAPVFNIPWYDSQARSSRLAVNTTRVTEL